MSPVLLKAGLVVKLAALAVAALALAGVAGAAPADTPGVSSSTILIGGTAPLTARRPNTRSSRRARPRTSST